MIWEEIDKSREEEYHKHWGKDFLDNKETEDQAREALEAYTSQASPSKEVELAACGAIVKYLLYSYIYPDRCTEAAMTEHLGVPRTRLRKILGLLEWQDIIVSRPVGKAIPYIVNDLSKAMREGYVQFSGTEADRLTRILMHTSRSGPLGQFDPWWTVIETVQSSIPNSRIITESYQLADRVFGEPYQVSGHVQVHRAFFPRTVSSTNPGRDDYMLTYFFPMSGLTSTMRRGIIARDVLLEMGVPESPEEFDEKAFREALARFATKNLKLSLLMIKPLSDLIGEYGFEEGRKKVEKSLYKDQKLGKGAGCGRNHGILFRYNLDPEMGHISTYTQEMTPSHVRFAVNLVRAAIRLAKVAGVGEEELEDAIITTDALETAVDKDYLGREREGTDLITWYLASTKA